MSLHRDINMMAIKPEEHEPSCDPNISNSLETSNKTRGIKILEFLKNHDQNIINFLTWRPFAYTSEVGEAFRPVIPKFLVNTAYGISIGYCLVDTAVKVHKIKEEPQKEIIKRTCDLVVWHGFASMFFPAFTIHTIVNKSKKTIQHFDEHHEKYVQKLENFKKMYPVFNKSALVIGKRSHNFLKYIPRIKPYIPTAIGLISIPFIIHPIDKSVDFVMNFIRPFYWSPEKIEKYKYKSH